MIECSYSVMKGTKFGLICLSILYIALGFWPVYSNNTAMFVVLETVYFSIKYMS